MDSIDDRGGFRRGRRNALRWLSGGVLLSWTWSSQATERVSSPDWPAWQAFKAAQIQADGRVIDYITKDLRSTSESQAYAMFFALVANDRSMFDKVWQWSRHNLMSACGSISLPGWLWGRSRDGSYRLLDANSASDADLWMAYALLEAERLWHREDCGIAGRAMLALIQSRESVDVPGLGHLLLPGQQGFVGKGSWKLNPSYLPIQVLRRCALESVAGSPWSGYPHLALQVIQLSARRGFAPDWVRWDGMSMRQGDTGSWDAIRTYLWAGMLSEDEPLRAPLLAALQGPRQWLLQKASMPERINLKSGVAEGSEPRGYAGALLPYLHVQGETGLLARQQKLIPAVAHYASSGLPYFERMLILFGEGWLQRRFRFGAQGQLMPAWA